MNYRKNRMAAIIVSLLFFMTLTACISTQSVVNRFGEKWIGRNFDEFVLQYGSPSKEFHLKNGGIAYTWNSGIASINMPASATTKVYGNTAYTQVHGGGSINMYCEMQLVTDSDGIIRDITILKDTIGLWVTSRCHEVLK